MSTIKFNEEQQQVINAPIDEIAVVAASAGSGKTTTLVKRIETLIHNPALNGKILAISFTRESAKVLREKLSDLLDEDSMKRIVTGTFHAVFGNMIRRHADALGIEKTFTIIDETATHKLIEQTIGVRDELEKEFEMFQDLIAEKISKKYTYKDVSNSVSLLVNNIHPKYLINKSIPKDIALKHIHMDSKLYFEDQLDFIVKVFLESFKEACLTNTLTYDQILLSTYLLAINGELVKERDNLGYILIDEFQDTNYLQYEIIKYLQRDNIMYIGDVNQSIYEFRGAKPELMSNLAKEHKVYNMSHNYRSYQDILDHANNVIQNNTEGIEMFKPMVQGAPINDTYYGTQTYHFDNYEDEAEKVTAMINKLINVAKFEPSDIAVLVRNRLIPPTFKTKLLNSNIPLNDTTKSADFIKSDTVKDIFSFLKILVNPKDIYSFMHTIDRPKKGIGPKTLEKIKEIASEYNTNLVEFVLSEQVEVLTPKLREKVIGYRLIYNDLLTNTTEHRGIVEIIKYIINKTGYDVWYKNLKTAKDYDSNLEKLYDLAEDFTQEYLITHQDFTIFDLVNDFLLEFSLANRVENTNGVVLSTIHNAKGLEWKFVFLLGCENGVLPASNQEIESDRRLMYVGMTRAQHGLIMTCCDFRPGFDDDLKPSIFIEESKSKVKKVY